MTNANIHSGSPNLTQLLAALLRSPPDDLPADLRRLVDAMRGEEEAHLPQHLFFEAVEQMSVAISITDPHADILYVNRAFERLTGYAASEIIGKSESVLSNRRTPRAVYVEMWQSISTGEAWSGRLINRRKDGSRYLAELSIVPVKSRDGATGYYLGMHRDITETHHLQGEVQNQKNLIETIIDSAPVVMALIDMKGHVLIENRAYRTLAAELKQLSPAALFLAALSGNLGDDLESALAEERSLSGIEVRIDGAEGRRPRWFSCSGRWVREFELAADNYFESRRQNALLLVCSEITSLKTQYEQVRLNHVRARMAEFELSRRTQEITEAALYQLQGPLNIMQAFIDLAQRQEGEHQKMRAALEEALASGRAAARSLRHALPSRVPLLQAPLNVNQLIRDVLVISADRLSAAGVIVDWQPQPELPLVYGVESAVQILIRALLDNAITAVGEPGAFAREVRIDSRSTGDGFVEICLGDSGPGVDRQLRAKCFEPFYSAWQRRTGSAGMGLAIARQIAGELGGDIRFEERRGAGCTICALLPSGRS